jgi:HlyD family secretion protein
VVARVADLSRFRVEASASDLHANRFAVGMPVRVEVGDHTLRGHVSSIPPAVENGVMTLVVELVEPSSGLLRSNMRVDVHVITSSRTQALKVKKGPFVPGSGEHAIYVVEGDEALRRTARIGVSGVDSYELVSGASEGEKVIVSSMEDFKHMERIRIR